MSLSHHHDGHVMPRDDQGKVRGMLRLKPDEEIPKGFLKLYWAARNLGDRISLGAMPDWHLVQLGIMSGCDVSAAPPPTIFELWRAREIKKGAKCVVEYRGDAIPARIESVDIARHKVIVSTPSVRAPFEVEAEQVTLGTAKPAKV